MMKQSKRTKAPRVKHQKSIKSRLLFWGILDLGVFLAVVTLTLFYVDKARQVSTQEETAGHLLGLTSVALENWIQDQTRLVQMISNDGRVIAACENPGDYETVSKAKEYLQYLHSLYPFYENLPLAAFMPDDASVDVFNGNTTIKVGSGQFFSDTVDGKTIGKAGMQLSYIKAIYEGKDYFISDVYPSILRGNPIFVIAAPVRNDVGRLVGAAIIAPQMSYFTELFLSPLLIGETGSIVFFDKRGEILAHKDISFVLDAEAKDAMAAITSRAIEGEHSFIDTFDGVKRYYYSTPVNLPSDTIRYPWYMAFTQDQREVLAPSYRELFNMGLIFVIFLVLYGLMLNLITARIVKPIGQTVAMLKDISEGEGDLTKRLDINSNDEMGVMANYFNLTLQKVRDLVALLRYKRQGCLASG